MNQEEKNTLFCMFLTINNVNDFLRERIFQIFTVHLQC